MQRIWDESLLTVAFIGLNPSIADENLDDPTIRRCINFSKDWGFGGLNILNLFALLSTDPKNLYTNFDPIGFENEKHILETCQKSKVVVAAWGNHGNYLSRDESVKQFLKNNNIELKCLGITLKKQPKHPLYIKAIQPLIDFK